MHKRFIVSFSSGHIVDAPMTMAKNMSNTDFWDLVTFLHLFPEAELVCDGDLGVVKVECGGWGLAYAPVF